jgi:ribosome biogenesis GTPase
MCFVETGILLMPQTSLAALGWSDYFSNQADGVDMGKTPPARIIDVYRKQVSVLSEVGEITLTLPPSISARDLTVGDWVLSNPDDNRVVSVLSRHTLLCRQSAGAGATQQLIAANVDTLMIVTSCNADFNLARLERYLILAQSNDVTPLLVLTKTDLVDNSEAYKQNATQLSPGVEVVALNAKDEKSLEQLATWLEGGKTVALVGSSGVGKSTIMNGLTGAGSATQSIRDDDAKGRHTTTSRSLRWAKFGGWLIDTPGIRSLGMGESAKGLERVFSDLTELATLCKFSDCSHETEPKCAINAAVEHGDQNAERVSRWKKLLKENQVNTESIIKERTRLKGLVRRKKPVAQKKRRGLREE